MRLCSVFMLPCLAAAGCGTLDEAASYRGDGFPAPAPEGSSDANGSGGPQPGTLTAGAWDDNRNYDFFTRYLEQHRDLPGMLDLTDAERDQAHQRFGGTRDAKEVLDIALIVDTTGSMGDEMEYLKVELDAIAGAIAEEFPNADQRYALVVYRDEGDDYVVRHFDFTRDLGDFQRDLGRQSANGGGDWPEASHEGLARAAQLSWRAGATARIAFWIADAPHHVEHRKKLSDAARALAELDVHVYPVAASGVDELAEISMRSIAQLTGGRYLFLTDDSGIGNEHKEPTLPCYFVTKLDDAMVRMAAIELSGVYREPDPSAIIRTGGDPKDGACTLEGGEVVAIF